MSEIIVIQVGQGGNQVGATFWAALCAEHGLDHIGEYVGPDEQGLEWLNVFFKKTGDNRFAARAILVDLEPDAIEDLHASSLGKLFSANNPIYGPTGGGNNWAKGYYTEGAELVPSVLDAIRAEAESCLDLQGFILIHALGGGTGAGMGSLILTKLREEYPDQIIATFSVFPSSKVSSVSVEPYNAVLSIQRLMEQTDLVFCLDNEALYDICLRSLGIATPTHTDLNQIIATALSSVTAPLRFPAQATKQVATLRDLVKQLVPVDAPTLHFLTVGIAPITAPQSTPASPGTAQELTRLLFGAQSSLTSANLNQGKSLATLLVFRGQVTPQEADQQIASLQDKHSDQFVTWLTDDQNLSAAVVEIPPNGLKRSAASMSNHTSIQTMLKRIAEQFTLLFKRKQFLNWYTGEGMDAIEFTEAESVLSDLIYAYANRQNTFDDSESDT